MGWEEVWGWVKTLGLRPEDVMSAVTAWQKEDHVEESSDEQLWFTELERSTP